MYADHRCFLVEFPYGLQHIISNFYQAYYNVNKTEMMSLDIYGLEAPTIKVGEDVLKQIKKFRYLGSTVKFKDDLDVEINNQILAAAVTFGKLNSKVFWSQKIKLDT